MTEEMHLRRLLFMVHPCLGKYGDDGEMQCNQCFIDFRRDPADYIERKWIELVYPEFKSLEVGHSPSYEPAPDGGGSGVVSKE